METHAITIPSPDQIRVRISACEDELRALRRLLRLSNNAVKAEEARRRRQGEEAGHATH
jgi:hypothetical protein